MATVLTVSDQLAKFSSEVNEDNGVSIWTDYEVHNHYEDDRHTYLMGVTSPNGYKGRKASVVQLALPTLIWVCDWTASRCYQLPRIPDPTPADTNWVLLDKHYETGNLVLMDDGLTPLYRISGTYVYGHLNPTDDIITHVDFARPPWISDGFDRGRVMNSSYYEKNLSDVSIGLAGKYTVIRK